MNVRIYFKFISVVTTNKRSDCDWKGSIFRFLNKSGHESLLLHLVIILIVFFIILKMFALYEHYMKSCILSFAWFLSVWILYAYVSEYSVCSIFIGSVSLHHLTYEDGTECSKTSAYKTQMPRNHPKERIQHSEHCDCLKSRIWKVPPKYQSIVHNGTQIGTVNHLQCLLWHKGLSWSHCMASCT